MSNDERVDALSKKLTVTLEYSDQLQNKQTVKPDKSKLQKLAHKIRKELEDIPFETVVHPKSY